jgi:competence protein ComEC
VIYFASFIYGAVIFYAHNFFPFISLFLSFLILAALFRKKYLAAFIGISVIALSGFFYARAMYAPDTPPQDIAGETIEVHASIQSEAIPLNDDSKKFSHMAEIKSANNEDGSALKIKKLRILSDRRLYQGKEYLIKARVQRDAYFLNPGAHKTILSAYALEIKDMGSVHTGFFERARARLNAFIKDNFSRDSAGFLMSIVTGERSFLTKESRDAFNSTGLAHILSISGAHFGLLLLIMFGFFRFLIKRLSYKMLVRLTLYVTPSQIAAALCVPVMIAYLGISDMSLPSIRAFIMITLFLFGLLIQRKGFWLNTLLFAAVVIILIQPDAVLDLSFQLSFIAVLCIGLITEQQRDRAAEQQGIKAKVLSYCSSALKISLAATIGTAPLVAYYFHYFSIISPATNLIITPIIGFVILPLALMSSFVFLVFGIFPIHPVIDKFTDIILSAVKHIAGLSFVDVKIAAFPLILLIMFYVGILVYIVFRGRKIFAVAAGIAVLPFVFYSFQLFEQSGIKITYLDVGQGDSAVIELPDKRTFAVDTGRSGFQTAGFLRYRGIKKIDAIILSHGQSDHAGGIKYLLRNFEVREVWDNDRLSYPEEFPEFKRRGLQRGDIIEGKGYKITVFHPYEEFYTLHSDSNDENNDSLIFRVQGRKNSFLFSGDVEEEGEEDAAHIGEALKSSVLKVAHHGSRTSTTEIFLGAVSPDAVVISVGRKNTYGHPHEETLDALADVMVFRTDRDGAIGIKELSDGSLRIRTWKEFQITEAKTLGDELMNIKRLFWVWP